MRFLTGDVVSGADLLLLAYDDFTGLAHQSLRFQEDLKPFFIHNCVASLMNSQISSLLLWILQ